jgi:hypothetical protein
MNPALSSESLCLDTNRTNKELSSGTNGRGSQSAASERKQAEIELLKFRDVTREGLQAMKVKQLN